MVCRENVFSSCGTRSKYSAKVCVAMVLLERYTDDSVVLFLGDGLKKALRASITVGTKKIVFLASTC